MTVLALVAASGAPQAAATECKPQPLPPAIESVEFLPSHEFNNVITFAATPSLEYPGRAWVIRLFQRTRSQPATLTIVRLLRRNDCNLYDVEARWEVPLRADEYETVATLVAPHAAPPPDFLTPENPERTRIVLDGTSLALRVETDGRQIRRVLNEIEPKGAALSAIFHRLLAPVVPAPERPGKYWSMNGG